MVTYQQLQNATLQDLQSNPELLKIFGSFYGDSILPSLQSGKLTMDQVKAYVLSNKGILSPLRDGSELSYNVSRYGNWIGSADPGDKKAAESEKALGVTALEKASNTLKSMGIDPGSVPQLTNYYTQLKLPPPPSLAPAQPTTQAPASQSSTPITSTLTLQSVLAQPNVSSDPKLVAWVNGNASLIPKLASLGYTPTDIANEAYSWTRNNRSAFSADMTTTQRSANTPYGAASGTTGGTGTSSTTSPTTETGTTTPGTQTNPSQGSQGALTPTQTGATPPAGALDIKGQRNALTAQGIDPSQLSDDQVKTLYSMNLVMQSNADKNKSIVPPSNSPADMENFLRQAKTEIDPYYAEQLHLGSVDILNAVADLSGDLAYKSQVELQRQQQDQQKLGNDLADRGLAYSGIRNKAETELTNNAQGLVRSRASTYQKNMRDAAIQYENTYGSDALRALNLKDLNYAGANIAAPTAIGGLMGTQPKQQTVDETQRQNQLAQDSLVKKGAMSGAITPFPVAS